MAGVWGKLRLHGDFLALGLDGAARACVVPWLDASLSALREEWGEGWGPRFDGMAPLGFWIGPAVTGGAPVAGVMAPSRDKVGRRYPLLILGRGEAAPPMLVPSRFHAAAGEALAGLLASGQADAAGWPRDLAEAAAAPDSADDPSLVWARNPGCSGAEVLAEIAGYDHAAACAGRVQVWTLGAPGVVLTCNGLPSAQGLGWLIEASQSDATGPADDQAVTVAPPPGGAEMRPEVSLAEASAMGLAAVPVAGTDPRPGDSASPFAHPAAGSAGAARPADDEARPGDSASPFVVAAPPQGKPSGVSPDPTPDATEPVPAGGVRDTDVPSDPLRLEPRFRLGAEEQADSRLVLRSEWALPDGAAAPAPVDAAIWQVADPAPAPDAPAPDAPRPDARIPDKTREAE